MYDLVIIGGGPGGYVAAIRGAQLGASVALIEREALGGVCLNRGCIPTKALLHGANLFRELKQADRLGIVAAAPTVDFPKMMARKDLIVKNMVNGLQRLMKANGIEVISGSAALRSEHQVEVEGRVIEAKNIIIAVGSSPVALPVPGADDPAVLTSDDVLALTDLPRSMAIIGGGVIGVEMAVLFASLGCGVTVIEMMDRLVPMMDIEIAKAIGDLLKRLGVKVFTGSRVESIRGGTVNFRQEDRQYSQAAEKILMAVGRRSNGLDLALDSLGIRHQKGIIATDERLRTNLPHIYAIGDVNGKYALAHVASAEGIVAVENIMGHDRTMNYRTVPQCIYTHPEVAGVGLTEAEAREQGLAVKISRIPLGVIGKAVAEGQIQGFVKLVAEEPSGRILGLHMVAPHATDMIVQGAMAIDHGIDAAALARTIFPHPTFSEALLEAAHGIAARPLHL
jgi:dihydrolipoamide dehydrogenase